jgi:cell division protein FtsL
MAIPLRRTPPPRLRRHAEPSPRPGIRTRRHGEVDDSPRPLVRATIGIQATSRPALALVPRRRRAAHLAVVVSAVVVLAMLAAAAFQTRLAKSQLELDRLDREISAQRDTYDSLRRERAELRSPSRLAEIAGQTGMVTTDEVNFISIDPATYAAVQQATGILDRSGSGDDELLEQFRDVKSVTDATP